VAEEPRLTVDVVALPLGDYQTNCYLVAAPGGSEAVVVDPGDQPDAVVEVLGDNGWDAAGILVTHGHSDHLGAIAGVAGATGAEVWMPRGEADELRTFAGAPYEPEHLVDGGETIELAGLEFRVTRPPLLRTRPTGSCSSATCCSRGRWAGPTCRDPTTRRFWPASPR
jgi:glyoxylase-like metal-dependent hydrolase (beta-lactamase superfamily II)